MAQQHLGSCHPSLRSFGGNKSLRKFTPFSSGTRLRPWKLNQLLGFPGSLGITSKPSTVLSSLTHQLTSVEATTFQEILHSHLAGTKRVVLVRHGESTWNAEGRIQGSSDFSVLTAKGLSQAETSRQMLLADTFDVCFHSPLQRSARTAEIIWDDRKQPMVPHSDLREIDLYAFQGLLKDEGKERYGPAYRTWQKDAPNFEIDGHFPVRELWARALSCWKDILQHDGGTSVLVVAHNAVNQALVATALGLGPEYFRRLLQSNCGVSVLDVSPGGVLPGSFRASEPSIFLNRLNQTPSPPVSSARPASGRSTRCRVLLVCTAATDSSAQNIFPSGQSEALNMLGVVQSRKTAELLLDTKIDVLFRGPSKSALQTSSSVLEVQEAADCLGADCIPRFVDEREEEGLRDVDWGDWKGKSKAEGGGGERQPWAIPGAESLESFWERSKQAWSSVLAELAAEASPEGSRTLVVVGTESVCAALLCHCLELTPENVARFHLHSSSLSVVDFPDGSGGRAVVRCLNYTAHLGRWAVPVTLPVSNDEDF